MLVIFTKWLTLFYSTIRWQRHAAPAGSVFKSDTLARNARESGRSSTNVRLGILKASGIAAPVPFEHYEPTQNEEPTTGSTVANPDSDAPWNSYST